MAVFYVYVILQRDKYQYDVTGFTKFDFKSCNRSIFLEKKDLEYYSEIIISPALPLKSASISALFGFHPDPNVFPSIQVNFYKGGDVILSKTYDLTPNDMEILHFKQYDRVEIKLLNNIGEDVVGCVRNLHTCVDH